MRTISLVVSLLLASTLFAQNDSAFTSLSGTYKPIAILTRADIERLPAFSFLELVQGAFPFIGNESLIEEEYSFIVDGFLSVNPNSINVSQIEMISFFPAAADIMRGNLTKKGTFVITFRTNDNGFHFSTKTGVVFENKKRNQDFLIKTAGGIATLNDLNYSHQSNDWYLSSSVSFLKYKSPNDTYATPFSTGVSTAGMHRLRFSNFGGYELNSHLKMEGGVFLTMQPQTSSQTGILQVSPANNFNYKTNSKKTIGYGGMHLSIYYTPTNQLKNEFRAEGTMCKDNLNRLSNSELVSNPYQESYSFTGHYKSYFFSDKISWQTKQSYPAQLIFSVFSRYGRWRSPENTNVFNLIDPNSNYSFSVIKKSNTLLVSPAVNLKWRQIVIVRAGAYYDSYNNTLFGKNQNKKILPDAGLKFDFTSLLDKSFISSLQFSVNYSKYITATETNDRFEDQPRFNSVPQGAYLMYADPGMQGHYPPVENWLGSLSVGLHNNAFMLGIHYRKFEKTIRAYVSMASGANFTNYELIMEPINAKGWCFEVSSSIIEKEKKKLKIYAMLFQDDYSIKYPAYPSPYDAVFADAGKAPWRGGLRASVTINHLFVQGSVLANFRENGVDKNNNQSFDVNNFYNNFLLAGYSVLLKPGTTKTLEFNAQAHNVFYPKPYSLQSYAGLGAVLNF